MRSIKRLFSAGIGCWFRRATLSLGLATAMLRSAGATPIIVDHFCVDASRIPDAAIAAARTLKLALRHASVGGNISDGLNDLQSANSRYNRTNLAFYNRGNPGWQAKVDDLVSFTASNSTGYGIITMKFCYIDQDANWTAYRDAMVNLKQSYPGVTFVWWTMPIMAPSWDGDPDPAKRYAFNQNVRAWCAAHDTVLFDIADVESHAPSGTETLDSGGLPAMYSAYTSDGGHLSTTGRDRVASAFWWMVARIGGWRPALTMSDAVGAMRAACGLASAPARSSSTYWAMDDNGDGRIDTVDAVRCLKSALAG